MKIIVTKNTSRFFFTHRQNKDPLKYLVQRSKI